MVASPRRLSALKKRFHVERLCAVLLLLSSLAWAQARPEDGAHEWQLWTGGGHGVSGRTSHTGVLNVGLRYGRALRLLRRDPARAAHRAPPQDVGVNRVDIAAFAKLSPTTLAEVVARDRVMDPGIRPLWGPMERLAGPAYPVACPAGDNLMLHVAIHRAPAGSVSVCAAGDSNWAMAGGNACA